MAKEAGEAICRLCAGRATYIFDHKVLEKYDVRYFQCGECHSLQTERPYWLAEAYGIPGVHIDVGQAARVMQTWLRLCFLLEQVSLDPELESLDYGGSAGLLTRLMRDSGYNFRAYDPYDGSKYANYFRAERLTDVLPGVISAFEVLEHFPDPAASLREILLARPELVVFTTQFYEGQGRDWDYLVPCCGQHVFFYDREGLAQFCQRAGFDLRRSVDFWVLVRRDGRCAASIEPALDRIMTPDFVARQVMEVGYGTEATARDHAYAIERFVRELRHASSDRKAPVQGRARRSLSALLRRGRG